MLDFFSNILDARGFMPHGMCLLWSPGLLSTLVISNAITAIAYLSIPISLFIIFRKRKDFEFNGIFLLFGAFIVLCGFTHIINIITYWYPAYRLQAIFEALTATASIFTALSFIPLTPKILKIPTMAEITQKNKQILRAETNSKIKSVFLANMSHELRTPLNSMMILSELLLENQYKNLNKDQLESLQIMNSAGKDLLTLIGDILDLSKIEAGKMTINYNYINLREIISDIYVQFKAQAEKLSLEYKLDVHPDCPEMITTEPVRLEQILKNILSNAFKFTMSGYVKINVYMREKQHLNIPVGQNPEQYIVFEIQDSGIGIPKEQHQNIFEAFQQIDDSISRKYAGTGLGLSISAQLVKLLKGHIELESTEGKGSKFSVVIPVKRPCSATSKNQDNVTSSAAVDIPSFAHDLKNKEHSANTNNEVLKDKKVLVVDDDMRNIYALTTALRKIGMSVLMASNGKHAIDIINKENNIDIILMDIMMPEMNGLEAIKRIREIKEYANLPIIVVTAKAMLGDKEKCISAGASGYITKPIDIRTLTTMMKM